MEPNAISEQYADWVANALSAAALIDPAQRDQPVVTGKWSVKDLLGHCTYWDGVHIAELEAEFGGVPGPEDDREDDVINAEQFLIRAGWSWDQVMDEVLANRDKLMELLNRPSQHDQTGTGEHWTEHTKQIQDFHSRRANTSEEFDGSH